MVPKTNGKKQERWKEKDKEDRILASVMCWAVLEEEELLSVGVVLSVDCLSEGMPTHMSPSSQDGLENPLLPPRE